MIVLYSTGCPLCKTLEQRMNKAGVSYTKITDEEEIMAQGFQSVPILYANGKNLIFSEAMAFIDAIIKENQLHEDQYKTG